MTRGNQRELAKAKNAKKAAPKGRESNLDMTPAQRREHDARMLAEKVLRKKEEQEAAKK